MDAILERPDLMVVAAVTAVALLVSTLYLVQLLGGPKKLLPLADFRALKLIQKDVLSHDVCRFTFELPAGHVLGLPTGQHVSLKYTEAATGKAVLRSYTPVTDDAVVGSFSLVIKVYKPALPKFPEGGKMSQHLDALKIGDTILCKGPKGHLHYHSPGKFGVKPLGKPHEDRVCQQIGMMAGGTGITPMLQILHAIFRNPSDNKTVVKLIYANNTDDDILVRKELEHLQAEFGDRFSVWYTLVDAPAGWKYDTGFIGEEMVQKHLLFSGSSKSTQFFMCGPPPMIKFACVPALEASGYSAKDWVIF